MMFSIGTESDDSVKYTKKSHAIQSHPNTSILLKGSITNTCVCLYVISSVMSTPHVSSRSYFDLSDKPFLFITDG